MEGAGAWENLTAQIPGVTGKSIHPTSQWPENKPHLLKRDGFSQGNLENAGEKGMSSSFSSSGKAQEELSLTVGMSI